MLSLFEMEVSISLRNNGGLDVTHYIVSWLTVYKCRNCHHWDANAMMHEEYMNVQKSAW